MPIGSFFGFAGIVTIEGCAVKYKIARIVIIGMICIFVINYLISHYDGEEYSIDNIEDYVIKVCKIGSVPGTVHNYATINYDVLALIIENVSGMS